MKEFNIPAGYENTSNVCPYCGYLENTKPKILYHLFPGTILNNRYVIGIVLGSGGFGVTYKAWDSWLDIVVAIKEYYPTTFVQRVPGTKEVIIYDGSKRKEFQDSLERFMEEAQNTAKFDNPSIVHVDNYFEENNTAYIVMEFLEGISLKDYLRTNGGKISISDLDTIFLPVMDALRAIHEKGIIHRDISPDNIFLCEHGVVKVIDFGAARFSDNEKEKTRSVILKPGYAPPEQYQSRSIQGPWTDIYALSATIYRAVTGQDPEESVNRFSEEFVKKKDLLVEPKVLVPDIPENLNNTIIRGMAIEPSLRFKSVDEFEAAYKGKQVRTPYMERKRRLIKRAIEIAVVAILVVTGALITANLYREKKKAVDIEATSVTMWLPYGENISEADAKEYGNRLVSDFQKEYSQVHIEITVIPEDKYSDKLNDAMRKGEIPTIFQSDIELEEIQENTLPMKDAMEYIEFSDLNQLERYRDEIGNCHSIPTGYYLPVVYVRKTNDVDSKNITVSKLEDVNNSKGFYADEKYLDITSKTMKITEEELKNNSKAVENPIEDFEKGEITYYLATTAEYDRVLEKCAGLFEMRPYAADVVYARSEDCWSISASADKNQSTAAEIMIAYMLMDSAQQQRIRMGYNNAIPFDKTAYDAFMTVNGKYGILEDYKEINLDIFK